MEREKGIVAKEFAMNIEMILRKVDESKYRNSSDVIRENLYNSLIEIMCNYSMFTKNDVVDFVESNSLLKNQSIDNILELHNGKEIVKEIISKLNFIITK